MNPESAMTMARPMLGRPTVPFPKTYAPERLILALSEPCSECWGRTLAPTAWREEWDPSGWQLFAEYECPACGYEWETWHSRAFLGWVSPALAGLDPLP